MFANHCLIGKKNMYTFLMTEILTLIQARQ